MESCLLDGDVDLNLVGTKFMKRLSRERKHGENSEAVEGRNERSLLEKQESHKCNFLTAVLADHCIASVHFQLKEKVKVFVDEGNNSRLIKELVRRRTNLRIVADKREANIVWTQFCDW
jgi:hypothetical protein